METFVLVLFWIMVASFVLKILITGASQYPRNLNISLGLDIADMISKLPFILWAAYLLWAA